MNKFKHPVSGLLSTCLACYERDGDNRLNEYLTKAGIAENIRGAIDSLESDAPAKPGSGCPEGYGLEGSHYANTHAVKDVLGGDMRRLAVSFEWPNEKHGIRYWSQRCDGVEPLSDTDRQFLEYLLAESSS